MGFEAKCYVSVHWPKYSCKKIVKSEILIKWLLFVYNKLLRQIKKKCTETESRRMLETGKWTITLDELYALIEILYARAICGENIIYIHSLWSNSWGLNNWIETIGRNSFCEILRFLRFDLKSTKSIRLIFEQIIFEYLIYGIDSLKTVFSVSTLVKI